MQRAFLGTGPVSCHLAPLEPPHPLQTWLAPGVPRFPGTGRSQRWGIWGCWFGMGYAAVREHILPRSESTKQRETWRTKEPGEAYKWRNKGVCLLCPSGETAMAGPPYLHRDAEVHHGDTGVAVPAHVHHRVATVRGLALQ